MIFTFLSLDILLTYSEENRTIVKENMSKLIDRQIEENTDSAGFLGKIICAQFFLCFFLEKIKGCYLLRYYNMTLKACC